MFTVYIAIFQWFKEQFCCLPPVEMFLEYLVMLVPWVGTYYVIEKLYRFCCMLHRQVIRGLTQSKKHMFTRYGTKESWALVTGGSDGIGLEMCNELARQGFNICMISRNEILEIKMKQKLVEVQKQN